MVSFVFVMRARLAIQCVQVFTVATCARLHVTYMTLLAIARDN